MDATTDAAVDARDATVIDDIAPDDRAALDVPAMDTSATDTGTADTGTQMDASDARMDAGDSASPDARDASADSGDASGPGCVITNVTDPSMLDDQITGAWALGPAEVPHMALLDGPLSSRQLVLAKLVGGAWQRSTLTLGATPTGAVVALAVDRDGTAHIATAASAPSDAGVGSVEFSLRYARVTSGGATSSETVARGVLPATIALTLSPSGVPTVLFSRDETSASRVLAAQRNADGTWTESDVGCPLPRSSITLQAASSSAGQHASALVIPLSTTERQRVLYASATGAGAAWRCETVRTLEYATSTATRTHSLAVTDAGDAVTISFRERTFSPTDSSPLWFARLEGARWNIVRSSGSSGVNPLFAASPTAVHSLTPLASSPPSARLERYDIALGASSVNPGSFFALASSVVPAQAWLARGGRGVIAAFTRPTSVLATTYELVHATCDVP